MRNLLTVFLSITLALANESEIKEFVAGSTHFSESVYNEVLVDNNGNILVSPFSVETLLALTQAGAVGTTGAEIRTSLYLPETKEETNAIIKSVLPTVKSDQYSLHTANKLYVENGLTIKDDFKKVATDVYQAAFQNVEFAENIATAGEINAWVEKETENKIHDLISPDDLDGTTRVVLVNALYFKANWSVPFLPTFTKKATFFGLKDSNVETDVMYHESIHSNIYESPELDAKFLELPFRGQNASMTFVLPNKKEGIALLERNTKAVFATPKYTKEFVEVTLPKFTIESSIDFKTILETLGVRAAFNPNEADFSGIAGEKGEILISKITQKTFIGVNEVGVEAAAATAIVAPTSVPQPPTQIFNADHPFAFYIKVNGMILFEGRVLEPSY